MAANQNGRFAKMLAVTRSSLPKANQRPYTSTRKVPGLAVGRGFACFPSLAEVVEKSEVSTSRFVGRLGMVAGAEPGGEDHGKIGDLASAHPAGLDGVA